MSPTSWIEIDLAALEANLAAWRRLLGDGCEVCPVIKADGYGLGAVPLAERLAAGGGELAAVYNLEQAAELLDAGLSLRPLVLMPVERIEPGMGLDEALRAGRLHLTAHSGDQLEQLERIGHRLGCRIPVHLVIDTGMHRLGMAPAEADGLLSDLAHRSSIELAGLMSHPSSADTDPDYTRRQLERFETLLDRHREALGPGVRIHFANSYAAMRSPAHRKRMVRLGLGLLGYSRPEAVAGLDEANAPALRPVLRWVSRVVHVRNIQAGEPVGYQQTFVTQRPTRLGIVPVGHADGYPLALSNRGMVRIGERGEPAPVRGQISMDQTIVDLTDLPEAGVGSEVELIGAEPEAPNALPTLAERAGANCYELLCRLSPRVARRYVEGTTVDGAAGERRRAAAG